jgi:hypothetical protein
VKMKKEQKKSKPRTKTNKYLIGYNAGDTFPDLFEVVKRLVEEKLGSHRGGLMLGITDLGMDPRGFIGAFFMIGSNAIVINRQPLNLVKMRSPNLHKAYMFYLLLHEYLHASGIIDEIETRNLSEHLCREAFGEQHEVTKIASNFSAIFSDIYHPAFDYMPPEDISIELIAGFDRSSVTYIQ